MQAGLLALHISSFVGEGNIDFRVFVQLALAPHNKFKCQSAIQKLPTLIIKH
jgi:hypothetical protein